MLEHETVKEFSNKLMKIVNQIRLHGEFLPDQRIVEKILICLPEKYEAKISTLEETRDLTQLTVAELINALQATEQRRSLRLQGESSSSEAALAANNKGSLEDMKSTFGYLFMSWSSHKQGTTAQSTAEAEYISAAAASNQAIWLRKLLGLRL
nr:uncharacterized protein LOC125423297 [Ziziphus jujuba var. spinosa]